MLSVVNKLIRRRVFHGLVICAAAVLICYSQLSVTAENEVETKAAPVDEVAAAIDGALYTRYEFFGAQAIVPYPTAEARNRLAEVSAKYRDKPQILLKLAQLDEKLGREEEALRGMQAYVDREPHKEQGLATLADFFHRRAQFEAEAETTERLLKIAPEERRVEIFRKLIELAQRHRLDKYLAPAFFEQMVQENPSAFEIVKQYQDKLIEDGDDEAALKLIRQNKDRFPEHGAELIKAEVS
ncbi:MAG TPA: hypothetical protein VFY51_04270, partial [Pyrinomonadaceae bacterium]|nr:hypothetical protein [Pyrinomonadaceae bacterium]